MSKKQKATAEPPQPPKIERRIEFHPLQMVGVPILMLLPVLGVFGLFGETFNEVSASGPLVEVQVGYPTRIRYKQTEEVQISVSNVSSQSIPTVTVSITDDYVSTFSEVTFTPDVDRITGEAYEVELEDVQPGETRQVSIDMRANIAGSHSGEVTVSPEGGEPVRARIDTFIFP